MGLNAPGGRSSPAQFDAPLTIVNHDFDIRAFVIGRQTDTQQLKMTKWGSEELEIPAKPLF